MYRTQLTSTTVPILMYFGKRGSNKVSCCSYIPFSRESKIHGLKSGYLIRPTLPIEYIWAHCRLMDPSILDDQVNLGWMTSYISRGHMMKVDFSP